MKIISSPTATIDQVYAWLDKQKPHPIAKALVQILWDTSVKVGINPIITICQAMKETGFFHFKGVLRPNFCNTCGLKGNKGGGDFDPSAHTRFEYWENGISAHVDHLALYAGVSGYPKYNELCNNNERFKQNGNTLDPRHFPYLHGTAQNVEDLNTKWAPSPTYGNDIVKMCNDISTTIIEENNSQNELVLELQDKISNLLSDNNELSNNISHLNIKIKTLEDEKEEIILLQNLLKKFINK